ncbi:pimeloyl-ACP methyl ester carboxylesterase [Chryseomicrobium aureum]|uniref:alpha/beta fold hydrolase n=1 Tax=Chryseomicrobium aureum TaxID=1441723 RepID=UPI00195E3813|nr:alpha/beta hydrolase [Chryseomicrobium aureum]MBM7706822.1 pimeloyl-ACP methyl ester carboxylesterase [Chryseomicrobium aureum]
MILHTTEEGQGTAIVLIHSGGMTGDSEYEEQSSYLAERGYRVIRPDLRGHGKSVGPFDQFFNRTVEDLKETVLHLGIEKCHVAGVSIGGVAAVLFAKRYPELVVSATFSGISPTMGEDYSERLQEEQAHYETLFKDEEISRILTELHTDNDWKALLTSFNTADFYPYEQLKSVASMETPLFCIMGDELLHEVEAAAEFKRLQPAMQLAILPSAGHLVHRDQPENYSRHLLEFISSIEI